MSVVNVTNLEGSTVTGKTAGAECGKTSLVSKLCKRVVLIHELRKGRRAEELTDSGYNGTDVDQTLRSESFVILNVHSLLNDLVHTGEADTELILEKLAYATETTVAEVVNVIDGSDVVGETYEIVDGGENIVLCNVLGSKFCESCLDSCLDGVNVALALLDDLGKNGKLDLLAYTAILEIVAENVLGPNGAVSEHLDLGLVLKTEEYLVNAAALKELCHLCGNGLARVCKKLAGKGRNYGTGKGVALNPLL
jgi:hypothetical protein